MNFYTIEGDIAKIQVKGGKTAIVDAGDIEEVTRHSSNWHLTNGGYPIAHSKIFKKMMLLHRIVFEDDIAPGFEIDHIDGNKLDARKSNLRLVTKSDNIRNRTVKTRAGKKVSSRFPGVSWRKVNRKWHAQIRIEGKVKNLGYFTSEIAAAKTYRRAMKRVFPEMTHPTWAELDEKPDTPIYFKFQKIA